VIAYKLNSAKSFILNQDQNNKPNPEHEMKAVV